VLTVFAVRKIQELKDSHTEKFTFSIVQPVCALLHPKKTASGG
jgi:hypothetical protein